MSKTLEQIAQDLNDEEKKVQLIYAFNGTGKTRLSKEFTKLVSPSTNGEEELTRNKILYYNAFTEDLFSWDNDLQNDLEPKLKIQPNTFTNWILEDEGKEQTVTDNFQYYTSEKLTPKFNEEYLKDENDPSSIVKAFSEVTFSFNRGDNQPIENIKISKGEESNFIWSIFNTLMEEVISVLNIPEQSDRSTDKFDNLEYIFIDDPVSSLDENHLIQLAVNLAELIKSSDYDNNRLKFVISTHNPLFYNVLYNELEIKKKKSGYMLTKNEDGSFELVKKFGDSNKSFSYHLYLIESIKEAIESNSIEKFHFMLLRNLYEKTANFLNYPEWKKLLPDEARDSYLRHIHFFSHKTLSNEEVREPTDAEKQIVDFLLNHLVDNYSYYKEEENNA